MYTSTSWITSCQCSSSLTKNPGAITMEYQSPPADDRCRYKRFDTKPDGQVACLAIEWKVVGITFQKVSTGQVKPILPVDSFSRVSWINDPTNRNPANNDFIDLSDADLQPATILPQWEDWAKTMKSTKQALLTLMESKADTLLSTFQRRYRDNPDMQHLHPAIVAHQAKQEGHVSDQYEVLQWLAAVTEGCSGPPSTELASCFQMLFPEIKDFIMDRQKCLYLKVPSTSETNTTIRDGVPHCLVYGFEEIQVAEVPALAHRPVVKPRYRVLQGKRSRSQSPESDTEAELTNNVKYVGQNHPQLNEDIMDHMLNNPDGYMLSTLSYNQFFEPHKPDLVCVQSIKGQSGDLYIAKLVCKIFSWNREGRTCGSFARHVTDVTEQCVQACLAALAYNQDSILGICVVVDGLKLVKVEKKRDNDDNDSYNIRETELIQWENLNHMYVLLNMIRNAIWQ